jgi:hypothetical protein
MQPARYILGALLWCVLVVPVRAEPMPERADLATFRVRVHELNRGLDRLRTRPLDAILVAESLPETVTVLAGAGDEYQISFGWLKEQLSRLETQDEEDRAIEIDAAQARLRALEQRLTQYSTPANGASETRTLATILSRREFGNVRGQPWTEQFREQVLRWLFRLVEALAPRLGAIPNLGRTIVIITVVLAVLLVGFWISRLIARSGRQQDFFLEGTPGFPSSKSWRVWLAEAHAAAAAGEWRDAIHLCYWAVISHLESSGAWRPDRARTPREYLSLLPGESSQQAPLRDLTRRFEMAWYAQKPVSQDEFLATLATAERMGCR